MLNFKPFLKHKLDIGQCKTADIFKFLQLFVHRYLVGLNIGLGFHLLLFFVCSLASMQMVKLPYV